MLEREIEQRLVAQVRARGGLAWKFSSPGTAGVPDRIVLMPNGHMAFVELKAPGKQPRPLQRVRMRQLDQRGFRTFVIDATEQIGEVLDEIQTS